MSSNPVQTWNFFRLSFRSLSCVVTARIFLLFDLSSAVQIYVSYIYIHLFILHGYTNSQYDQLPVGLIAYLVEHCTGIAEVMGSNSLQAFFSQLLKLRSNCEDLSSIWTTLIGTRTKLSATAWWHFVRASISLLTIRFRIHLWIVFVYSNSHLKQNMPYFANAIDESYCHFCFPFWLKIYILSYQRKDFKQNKELKKRIMDIKNIPHKWIALFAR